MDDFSLLPPLEISKYSNVCKICCSESYLLDILDFNKYCSDRNPYAFGPSRIPIEYYRCPKCELIYTSRFDLWGHSEFSTYIYNADYPKVDPEYDGTRARNNARLFNRIMEECRAKRVLDYGSGGGALREELGRYGFENVFEFDPYSSPSRPDGRFDIIIMMEVMEHAPHPLETMEDVLSLLADDGILIVGQFLQPADIYRVKGGWWYLAPRNGHVSTYSEKTFMLLAEMGGLQYRRGGALYCFVRGEPDVSLRSLAAHFQPGISLQLLTDQHLVSGSFHGVEQNEFGQYQWSSEREYRWDVAPDPHNFRLAELPYCMSISETYAAQCEVRIGGNLVEAVVIEGLNHGSLRFEVPASSDVLQVRVTMPEPITPREAYGGDDDRPLGLAVFTKANSIEALALKRIGSRAAQAKP